MSEEEKKILFYGTSWCYSSRKARTLFDQNHILYEWIDIDYDEEARKYVESVNRGFRSVPTLLFPDGTLLVEPTTDELCSKLGIEK
jgi:mycoredoxin